MSRTTNQTERLRQSVKDRPARHWVSVSRAANPDARHSFRKALGLEGQQEKIWDDIVFGDEVANTFHFRKSLGLRDSRLNHNGRSGDNMPPHLPGAARSLRRA